MSISHIALIVNMVHVLFLSKMTGLYIEFGLVWFYAISTIVGYLMPNPLYTCILNI